MRVAILSDTHGVLDERIAAQARSCDYAIHAGDVGSRAVIDSLTARRAAVLAVRGNNDVPAKWAASERDALDALPDEVVLSLPGGDMVVVHGHRAGRPRHRHRCLRDSYPDARAVVYGHSHQLCIDKSARPWILNPGAAGRARTYGGPSCLILRAGKNTWRIEERRFEILTAPSRRR